MKRLLFSLFLLPFMGTAYAGGPAIEKASGWHAYISGYGGGFFDNIDEDRIVSSSLTLTSSRTDSSSRGFGGASFGAYTDLTPETVFGAEISITGVNSSVATNNSHFEATSVTTYTTHDEFKLRYNVDIAATLGTPVNGFNVYGKVGGSYGNVKGRIQGGNAALGTFGPLSRNKGVWGVVAGVGVSREIAQHISLYAEYDYYYYNKLTVINNHVTAAGTLTFNRSIRLRANTFRVGVSFGLDGLGLPDGLSDLHLPTLT